MIILDVRTRRRSLYALLLSETVEEDGAKFDDSGFLLIDRTAFDETGLKSGCEIDDEQLSELIEKSAYYRARERALYYLSNRDYAEKEMSDKLRREFGHKAAERAAARMVELGLIDDERYAFRYAEVMLNVKVWSPSRAVRELTLKGIDRDTAEQAVSAAGRDARDLIRELIDKKYAALLASGDKKAVSRVINALARKGYSFSDIRSVISDYCDGDGFYD